MFLHEIIFLVKNCMFHEMIISDNTERGSIKLTCCSCRKKGYETENLSAKERWNTKQNLHLSWSFLLPNLRSRVLCGLFSPRRARSCQSNHLLENPRYTLTERLLANLTHLRFVFGFFLAHKNGFESVWFSETFHTRYRSISRTLLPGLSRQSSTVSESRSNVL